MPGTAAFAQRLGQQLSGQRREHTGLRRLERSVSWKEIMRAAESQKGEPGTEFVNQHEDWGRDAALWLGRRLGRL